MDRRTALRSMAAAAMGAPSVLKGRWAILPGVAQEYSARAVRLVEESTVVDLLCQFRFPDYRDGDPTKDRAWLNEPSSFTEEDWARYRDSGVDVLALGRGAQDYEDALRFFAQWNGFIASNGHRFGRIDSADDFQRVRDEGKVGVLLTFQNSEHFRRAADVDEFYRLGQRLSQLTYNYQNLIGAGFLENRDSGLAVFGHDIVARMNQVGMAVDATGGVMGINFIRFMVRLEEPVTVEHVLDHFDYVARLVGVEHLGIGSDLDIEGNASPLRPPDDQPSYDAPNFDRYQMHMNENGRENIAGLDHTKRVFDLTKGLIRRGWSDADISLMLGGNFKRVLSEIWV